MSAEWGTLQQPTLPAPEPDESSASVDRAARSSSESLTEALLDELPDNEHLRVPYNGEQWLLPGGGLSGDRCQEWRPKAVCDDCGHVEMVEQRCDRWLCPDCWARAANRFSINAAKRVQAFRYTQPDDYRRQWAHAVVSPADSDVTTRRELFDNRTTAADIAQEKGFRGCSVVAHSHRATDLGKELFRADVDRDDDGEPVVGYWVWLRNYSDELAPDTSDLIEWSPHYHIIGPTSPDMAEGKQSDDWKYHVIRFNEYDLSGIANSRDSHEELFGTYRYLASHIMQPDDCDRQMVTWHGCLANSVFVSDASEEWQYEKPSEGAIEAIKHRLQDIAGPTPDRDDSDGDGDESDDLGDCPERGCDGNLIAVWDINQYLDQADPPPDVLNRMQVARDWASGEIEPPGGLKHPSCERDARLAFGELV